MADEILAEMRKREHLIWYQLKRIADSLEYLCDHTEEPEPLTEWEKRAMEDE